MYRWFALFLGVMLGAGPAWAAGTGHWQGVAERVCAALDHAETAAAAGRGAEAKDAVIEAYFGLFEGEKMETAERSLLGARRVAAVEEMFNTLRKAAGTSRDVHAQAEALRQTLRADAAELDKEGK